MPVIIDGPVFPSLQFQVIYNHSLVCAGSEGFTHPKEQKGQQEHPEIAEHVKYEKGADVGHKRGCQGAFTTKGIGQQTRWQFQQVGRDLPHGIKYPDLGVADSLIHQEEYEEGIKKPEVLQEAVHTKFDVLPVF